MKRKDYLSWEEYFMGLALLSAQRSKDPNSQVGACVVDENNKIVSVNLDIAILSATIDDGVPSIITMSQNFPYTRGTSV